MSLADDLLLAAADMLSPAGSTPTQAHLRRSISTAYYALFHVLT